MIQEIQLLKQYQRKKNFYNYMSQIKKKKKDKKRDQKLMK